MAPQSLSRKLMSNLISIADPHWRADTALELGPAYRKYKNGFWVKHWEYTTFMAEQIAGYSIAELLHNVFYKELKRTCESKKELMITFRSR